MLIAWKFFILLVVSRSALGMEKGKEKWVENSRDAARFEEAKTRRHSFGQEDTITAKQVSLAHENH